MFKKILIANRGEIAVRIIAACREMGIATVAVYSDVDRAALHVRKSDEAYFIGPAPAAESYLRTDRILGVAKRSGAEAIHPGYGFLSENATFAQACADAGVKFIGPTPHSMEMMGSKTRARQEMEKAGVPVVPGTSRGLVSPEEGEEVAARIGYPVMLKAAAGGGGKGMRLVHSREELRSALESAQSEAQRSFGDSEVYIEKAIVNPRHIEMQVLADEHGNTVWLGERECSIQRRHQKVIEEAPSPIVDPDMRRRMGEVAVKVAQAADYTNAGTVEFLVDREKNFYFLEMNTRLQVEHPVTELTTGLDLVHLQIRIAAGEKLPFKQSGVEMRGHAIECRIYAEDPDTNYFPSPGKIMLLLAIMRLQRALGEYLVAGIKTNISLFQRILGDADFLEGKLDTGYLDRWLAKGNQNVASRAPQPRLPGVEEKTEALEAVAAIAGGLFAVLDPVSPVGKNGSIVAMGSGPGAVPSNWKQKGRSEALR